MWLRNIRVLIIMLCICTIIPQGSLTHVAHVPEMLAFSFLKTRQPIADIT